MYDVTAIGEALIDFIPAQRDCALKEVESFTRVCGGAPTNVAAVVAKLQGNARLLTQVGNDAFGDYIVDTIQACGVKTDGVCRTDAANTALAFVSLKADGNRDFSFYRKPVQTCSYSRNRFSRFGWKKLVSCTSARFLWSNPQ